MSDEELLAWVDKITDPFKPITTQRAAFFLTPTWAVARDRFESHPYSGNLDGLRNAIFDACRGKPLALAMLREFHAQYTVQILTS